MQIFIKQRWRKSKKIFIASFCLYLLFLLLFSLFLCLMFFRPTHIRSVSGSRNSFMFSVNINLNMVKYHILKILNPYHFISSALHNFNHNKDIMYKHFNLRRNQLFFNLIGSESIFLSQKPKQINP